MPPVSDPVPLPTPIAKRPEILKLLPVMVLGVILSGSVIFVGVRQIYQARAGTVGQIARVDTQPAGDIIVPIKGKTVYLSALAYDNNGNPILTGVTYQWGISSSGSLGKFVPNNELASFTPATSSGMGDLFVQANTTTGLAVKSQKIYVGMVPPSPTPF